MEDIDIVTHPVIIIGGGAAALTAGIYTARADLKPLIFEGEWTMTPGGQLTTTTEIENFPGTKPEGISGFDLIENMKNQAKYFGSSIISETVTDIRPSLPRGDSTFWVTTTANTYKCNSIILATGATAKYLGLDGEKKYANNGVSACATCDGALPRFRNKEIVVVGGGDTAMEESMFLSRFASKVHLVHRRDTFRASKVMSDRVLNNDKIQVHWNTVVTDIIGTDEDGVTSVLLKSTKDSSPEDQQINQHLNVVGYFAAIGHKPNSNLVINMTKTDLDGYLVPGQGIEEDGLTATNWPGLFVAGDVMDRRYRQAITAAGSGCMAAIDATRWLESNK